ncbi:pilus assembly protein TadG-related protein [Asticcacaulis biprosthecium]|uniref:pilus assembly protein TadG-related protein n=1 Tax=Asticcacaulis biprosthecium TaxID=76891 RepID=UPI00058EE727|nr:pilus assembly protein TadG-related protein [Asticcacaulis biprosthecium]
MFRVFQRRLRRFARNTSGNVATIFAFSLPLVAGGAAFGLDSGIWYLDQTKLQQAADAAAYAAGLEKRAGGTPEVMLASARAAAAANGFKASLGDVSLNAPPTSGTHQNDKAAEVILTRREPRYFSQLFDDSVITLRSRAVAHFENASNACVLALDTSANQAAYFSGNSTATFIGCNVMTNSLSASSIYSQGSTRVTAPCLMTTGGVSLGALVTQTVCESAMVGLPPVADPFRNVPEPTIPGACQNSNGATLQPGRYCGGLSINKNVNFNPGVYIIDGGTFRVNGNSTLNGSGVIFYLANNATLAFNGNTVMNLSPPTSGTYSGMLFFGSRSNATTTSITVNGNAASTMTGAIYFPKQPVSYLGNFQGANGCTQLVARTVSWSGNTTLKVNCAGFGMGALAVGGVVKLVE